MMGGDAHAGLARIAMGRDAQSGDNRHAIYRCSLSVCGLDVAVQNWVEQQFVFPGRKPDQPLNNIKKALRAAVKKANILRDGKLMNVTLQSFRKAYASWHDDANTPLSVIQANMGHSLGSEVTRRHYQRAFDSSKRQSVIDLDVPLSVRKNDGRWQRVRKMWQSVAMPENPAEREKGDVQETPDT